MAAGAGILDTERAAILALYDQWAQVDGSHRKLPAGVGPSGLGAHLGLLGDRRRHIDRRIPLQAALAQLARRRKQDDEPDHADD